MTLAIVLTHTPGDASPVSRFDFNMATGEMDVTWRLTGQTHRYKCARLTFSEMLRSETENVSHMLGQIRQARLPGTVAEADLLAARFPVRLSVTTEDAAMPDDELKARWFRAQMTQGPAASQWVETALFS